MLFLLIFEKGPHKPGGCHGNRPLLRVARVEEKTPSKLLKPRVSINEINIQIFLFKTCIRGCKAGPGLLLVLLNRHVLSYSVKSIILYMTVFKFVQQAMTVAGFNIGLVLVNYLHNIII
jgi:hypothetical protein